MLDGGRDQVSSLRLVCFAQSADGKVIRLGAARDKDDLIRPCGNERCRVTPRAIDCRARFLAEPMHTRSITELASQIRQHRIEHTTIDWSCRAVVEVNIAGRR